jgi:hypothetical protein
MRRWITISISGLLLLAPETRAQSGTVKSDGLPIPGASVSATQGERVLRTLTDENGAFQFTGMSPGIWVVEAQMFGFAPLRREVQVGDALTRIDLTLQLPARSAPGAPALLRPQQQPQGAPQVQDIGEVNDAAFGPPPDFSQFSADSSNESFLVNGTVSRGLDTTQGDFRPDFPGGFGPGMILGGPGGGIDVAQIQQLAAANGITLPPEMLDRLANAAGQLQTIRVGPDGPGGGPGGGGIFTAGAPGGAGPGGGAVIFRGPGGDGPGGGAIFIAGGPGGGGPGGGGGGRGGFQGGRGGGGPGGRGQGGRGAPPAARNGQGRAGQIGGLVGNRSRRAANQIRTQFFYTARNAAFDARPFSLNGQEIRKASYAQNRFGINLGGPLAVPKLFDLSNMANFMVNFDGMFSRNPFNAAAAVPTLAERAGDFSASPNIVYDPLTRQPFPGNRIPVSRLDPIALGLLPYIPVANQPGTIQNYQFISSAPANNYNFATRAGFTFNRRDRLNAIFNLQNRNGTNLQPFGFRDENTGRGVNVNLNWSHSITNRFFNNLTVGYNRNRSELVPFFAYGADVARELGIQGASGDPRNFGPPNLNFTNYGGLTDGSPNRSASETRSIQENMSYSRGRYNWTWGGDYRWYLTNTVTDANGRGTFTFSGLGTSALDEQGLPVANTGWDFADFLLGGAQSTSIRYGASSQYFRSESWSAFVNNDWRARSNLTINTGLRYEFFSPVREKFGRLANLDIAPGFRDVAPVLAGGVGPFTGQFPKALIDPDRNNFAPRFGLAWRPRPRSSLQIRAGYGVYYNQGVYNQFGNRLAQQPPFANASTINTTAANPLTLATGLTATPVAKTVTNSFAVNRHYLAAYAQTWNVLVQRNLPAGLIVEVGYTGTKGTRLDIQRLPNRAAPGSPLTAEQRRQIGNAVGFTFDSPDGNSILHSGTLRVNRRLRNYSMWNVQYTWAKSIDNSSTFGGAGNTVAQDDQNISLERGLSSFNRAHVLNLNYMLQSPVGGRNAIFQSHPWVQKAFKDWTLNGTMTLQSGTPLTARVLGNQGDSGGTGSIGSGRADATGLPVAGGGGYYFNPAAFALPPAGRFGNAGRNTITGPGMWVMNLSLARNIQLGERRGMEIRVDANNFLNHANISNVGTVVNSLTYGLATAAGNMRTMTATLRFRF